MRLIIIVGGLILVILLGGSVAYFLVPGSEEPEAAVDESVEEHAEEEHAEEEHAEEEHAEEEHAEEGAHGAPAGPQPQYVQLEVLSLPVVRGKEGKELTHYVNVEASLQSPDKRTGSEIQANLAYLRDAIIRDLYRNPLTTARGAKVDDAVLKARILAAARQVLAEDVVEDVLLINVRRSRR